MNQKIKEFQTQLGVLADGEWGPVSQAALIKSKLAFSVDLVKLKSLLKLSSSFKSENLDIILAEINKSKDAKNPLFVPYILATVYHETAGTFSAIEEYGKGSQYKYGKVFTGKNGLKFGVANSKGDPYSYSKYPHLYYGRGLVQLTWFDNYKKYSEILGQDILNKPELACDIRIATDIMLHGMLNGGFTGMSLSKSIKNPSLSDYIQARKIINGSDKAELIANYALKILDCLRFSV